MDAKIPIYCINLEKHANRRFAIQSQIDKLHGQPVNFYKAIDGTTIPRASKFTCCRSHPYRASYHHPDKDYVNLNVNGNFFLFNSNLLQGEIGLALSLFTLYYKLIAENVQWAIIIEDDVIFADNFIQELKQITADIPYLDSKSVDIIFLNNRMHRHTESPAVNDNLLNRYYPVKGGFGFDGYLISKMGMLKLLHVYNPLFYPVDLQVVPHLQRYPPRYQEMNLVKPGFTVNGYKYYTNLVFHTDGESSIARACPYHA